MIYKVARTLNPENGELSYTNDQAAVRDLRPAQSLSTEKGCPHFKTIKSQWPTKKRPLRLKTKTFSWRLLSAVLPLTSLKHCNRKSRGANREGHLYWFNVQPDWDHGSAYPRTFLIPLIGIRRNQDNQRIWLPSRSKRQISLMLMT